MSTLHTSGDFSYQWRIPSPFRDREPFTLKTTYSVRDGREVISYRFGRKLQTSPIFESSDFYPPASRIENDWADDPERDAVSLLMFLTLRPGDTDAEYFEAYNDAQRAWADSSECEYLAGAVSAAEEAREIGDLLAPTN